MYHKCWGQHALVACWCSQVSSGLTFEKTPLPGAQWGLCSRHRVVKSNQIQRTCQKLGSTTILHSQNILQSADWDSKPIERVYNNRHKMLWFGEEGRVNQSERSSHTITVAKRWILKSLSPFIYTPLHLDLPRSSFTYLLNSQSATLSLSRDAREEMSII